MGNLGAKGFNPNEVPPSEPGGREPIPVGQYMTQITASAAKTTKKGDGKYINMEFTVADGPYKGRKVFMNFNIENPNPQAQQIGLGQLSALCHAIGYMKPMSDTSELHGRFVALTLDIKPGEGQYGPQNEIKKFSSKLEDAPAGMPANDQMPWLKSAAAQ